MSRWRSVMGNEVFREVPKWHEAAQLVQNADFVVVMREGVLGFDPKEVLERAGIFGCVFRSEKERPVPLLRRQALGGTNGYESPSRLCDPDSSEPFPALAAG